VPPDKRGSETRTGHEVQARCGEDGVVVLRFAFRHVP
jgi:hypothetical protein